MAEDLEALVKKLLERVDRLEAELAAAKRELARKDQIIAALQHRLFGSKSERYHPDQEQLDFGEDVLGKFEPSSSNPTNEKDEAAGAKAGGAERRSKRDLLPQCLRVEVVKVIIPDEVLANPDAFIEIGELHHDELAVQKAEIYWLRQIRKKYKLRDDREAAPVVVSRPASERAGNPVRPRPAGDDPRRQICLP
jgi:methyl coenzyme M reductase gamma subunit